MKQKYTFTAAMDDEIRYVYRHQVRRKQGQPVKDLSLKWGISMNRISARASALGVIAVERRRPPWTEEELAIVEKHGHKSPGAIRVRLKASGYVRSDTAIRQKLKEQNILQNLKGESVYALAECFGIHPKTISSWITRGLLHAKQRGTNRTEKQGGDAWFITTQDVRQFVKSHLAIIDFTKVDKYWLVDLLLGKDEAPGPFAAVAGYYAQVDQQYTEDDFGAAVSGPWSEWD
jgi:hypothetical protein